MPLFYFAVAALAVVLWKKADTAIVAHAVKMNTQSFHQIFLDAAKNVEWSGIPPKFALAMSDLETGKGTGSVFLKTKNLFSISVGSGWKGHWNGKVYTSTAGISFRSYDTLEDSMRDFVTLLHFPLYKNALQEALVGNIGGFANAIKAAGYDASEPKYAALVVDRYNAITAEV